MRVAHAPATHKCLFVAIVLLVAVVPHIKATSDAYLPLYVDSSAIDPSITLQSDTECHFDALASQGQFRDRQELFQSVFLEDGPPSGGIFYITVNARGKNATLGEITIGVGTGNDEFVGFTRYDSRTPGLGVAVRGTIAAEVFDPMNPRRRAPRQIQGGGGTVPPGHISVRTLQNIQQATGGVDPSTLHSNSGPTTGACISGSCPIPPDCWELRIIVKAGLTQVWASSINGYEQFLGQFSTLDLRSTPLRLHAFAGAKENPILFNGLDLTFKHESTFSRVLGKIWSATNLYTELTAGGATDFSTHGNVPIFNSVRPCPELKYSPATATSPSIFVPLLSVKLPVLDVNQGYLMRLTLFTTPITQDNDIVFGLYDGDKLLATQRVDYTKDMWGSIIEGQTSDLSTGLTSLEMKGRSVGVGTGQILSSAYTSKRIELRVPVVVYPSNNAGTSTILGWDPARETAQSTYAIASDISTSLQKDNLRVVVLQGSGQASGITGLNVVIDTSNYGCDGVDYGANAAPDFDRCGVCGGTDQCSLCTNGEPIDACGVCGGDNSTCCIDYNGVSDVCWAQLLLPDVINRVKVALTNLKHEVGRQCDTAVIGTEGITSCCAEATLTTDPGLASKACETQQWNSQCLEPLNIKLREYIDALKQAK